MPLVSVLAQVARLSRTVTTIVSETELDNGPCIPFGVTGLDLCGPSRAITRLDLREKAGIQHLTRPFFSLLATLGVDVLANLRK